MAKIFWAIEYEKRRLTVTSENVPVLFKTRREALINIQDVGEPDDETPVKVRIVKVEEGR